LVDFIALVDVAGVEPVVVDRQRLLGDALERILGELEIGNLERHGEC
jgi:hypothetical protein